MAKENQPKDGAPETSANDLETSTAGTSNNTSGVERPTLPTSVGPNPHDGIGVFAAIEHGEIHKDADTDPSGVSQALRQQITGEDPTKPKKAKPGKVKIEHHDDGWSGRLVFTGWHEGAHKGYVRLQANDRDVKFPVEWVGPEQVVPLDWQPTSVLLVADGHDEQRVQK